MPRMAVLAAAAAVVGGVAGCGLRGLAHDQLYGSPDAGRTPDTGGDDARPDAQSDADAGIVDVAEPDATERDLATDQAGEAGDTPPPPCSVDSCSADQFCDDVSGRCVPRTGTGMLSGAAVDACNHLVVSVKVGIAGRHLCSDAQKGAYFFSQLPLGKLTVTAAAPGYDLYVAVVTIVPGGNVLEVPMIRSSPGGCADPMPAAVACTCTDSACP